jgi:hypothetical protein
VTAQPLTLEPLGSPHPPLGSPHPALGSPHPALGSPHPPLGSPHPPLGSPHPFPRRTSAPGPHSSTSAPGPGSPLTHLRWDWPRFEVESLLNAHSGELQRRRALPICQLQRVHGVRQCVPDAGAPRPVPSPPACTAVHTCPQPAVGVTVHVVCLRYSLVVGSSFEPVPARAVPYVRRAMRACCSHAERCGLFARSCSSRSRQSRRDSQPSRWRRHAGCSHPTSDIPAVYIHAYIDT